MESQKSKNFEPRKTQVHLFVPYILYGTAIHSFPKKFVRVVYGWEKCLRTRIERFYSFERFKKTALYQAFLERTLFVIKRYPKSPGEYLRCLASGFLPFEGFKNMGLYPAFIEQDPSVVKRYPKSRGYYHFIQHSDLWIKGVLPSSALLWMQSITPIGCETKH